MVANNENKERRNTADDTAAGRAQGKSSKWIEKIRRDQLEKKAKEEELKKDREARWKLLLDSDSEGEQKNIDYKDMRGPDMANFLEQIDAHLKAEQAVLDAWQYKDKKSSTKPKS